jgi:starvation-inducible DNA-binding protein
MAKSTRNAKSARSRASSSRSRRTAPLATPNDIPARGREEIAGGLLAALADVFALYVKTKNFHWHVSGPHFRDYHLLFDEQAAQLLATIDPMAERARKLGAGTIRSIGQIARLQRVLDLEMIARLRELHGLCDEHDDIATASLIENWVDEAEGRVWFLFEASQR